MQCQFCKQMLEDVNALQLHQVASCPAMDHSVSFEDESVEVVFKWLVDRVTKVPAVFLIGSNMEDNIELKKGVGCYKSAQVTMSTGKYSGQLVIDNDIAPVNDFEITLFSEVIHLIVNQGSSLSEISSNALERDGGVALNKQDGILHKQQSSSRDIDGIENTLSPLHQEMLDHQIKNDFGFGDNRVSSKLFGNLLSEEDVEGANLVVDSANYEDPTLHQADDLSPDFSRISFMPRDGEADDSFYQSFATPSAFETIDPDSTPSTPVNNPSLYPNMQDILSEVSTKDGSDGMTSEPSMHSYVSAELLQHELEDAMRDTPGSRASVDNDGMNTLLNENDGSHRNKENLEDHILSVDYAGNPMSKYDIPSNSDGNPINNEMERMVQLIDNYKEVKVQLETKCESYDHEVDRLKKKCTELEQTTQSQVKINNEKDGLINDLKVKAESYESEMNRLNQEVGNLTELLEEGKAALLEEVNKGHSYELEINNLTEKCTELAQNKEVEKLTKLLKGYQDDKIEMEAKCESYSTETNRLTKKCTDLEKLIEDLQQENLEQEKTEEIPCRDSDMDSKKDHLIAELSQRVESYESEMDRSKKELLTIKELLDEHKTMKLQLETQCGKYESEMKELSNKCEELEKQNDAAALNKEADKSKSYKAEIKRLDMELQKLSGTLETYKEHKVLLESKCAASNDEVKQLQDKCMKLEQINENQLVVNESDSIKDRIIGDLKVKAESFETEMNRLHQEVKRLTELVEEYKNIKHVLESKCQSYEQEIESLKEMFQEHEKTQKTNDLLKVCQDLEQKCEELQNSNKKLLEDYKGLEGAKNVYEEEVQAERERYEGMIKDLVEEKSKLILGNKQENKYTDNHARMNINKLKSENKILREKLNLIRNESELNDSSTSKENISPRSSGYKPPLLPNSKSYEPEPIKVYNCPSQVGRHKHTSSNDDYTLPSRYNANKYSTSPESYRKNDFVPRISDSTPSSSMNRRIDNIMKRYSSPANIDISADSIHGRSKTRTSSHQDPLSYCDHNSLSRSKLFSSNSRSRSLDHLDISVTEDTLFYKQKSLTTIPFCPTSVKELSVGMKISVNRANGRLSRGTIKWIGTLPRHSGDYVGVELESEVGKHDGNLNGIQYFKCKSDHGIFVKFPKVIMAWK